ncbi:MAG: redoxin domain-containing protein [Planctomycetota bacterium]
MPRYCFILLLTTCLLPLVALDVGAKAPTLEQATYITGTAPTLDGDHWTVVEFWATWCPPCRESIPHLSQLQQQYPQELVVVGLSNEDQATVRSFVDGMGNQMAYTVGIAGEALYQSYMDGVSGIPHAFLVNPEGEVVWQGHPMQLDRPVQAALGGELEGEEMQDTLHLEQALQQSFATGDLATITRAAEALLAKDPSNELAIGVLLQLAENQEDPQAYRQVLEEVAIDELPGNTANNLAWQLIIHPELDYRNLDIALKLAEHAVAEEPEAAHIADTRARAYMLLGDLDAAIAEQKRALELDPEATGLEAPLTYYQQAKSLAQARSGNKNDNDTAETTSSSEDVEVP